MDLPPHLLQQLTFGLILAGGLYLFITEKLRVDVTAMLILLMVGIVMFIIAATLVPLLQITTSIGK